MKNYLIYICFANPFLPSSFVDYSIKQNQAEEIIYLNYKIRWNITPQTFKLHLVIHQQLQQQTEKPMNKSKNSLVQQIKSSSEESLKVKCHTFIDMCSIFTWFNMQVLNLYHRWPGNYQSNLDVRYSAQKIQSFNWVLKLNLNIYIYFCLLVLLLRYWSSFAVMFLAAKIKRYLHFSCMQLFDYFHIHDTTYITYLNLWKMKI